MANVIGLTGPTGSGKSILAEVAQKLGYTVIDADKICREAYENPSLIIKIGNTFKGTVKDGTVDRKALADAAFKDKKSTELLNSTVLPFITDLIKQKIDTANTENILLDAPTLFEAGADALCNKILCVIADGEIRKKRIAERDGLLGDALEHRMSAAKNDGFFTEKCDKTVYNNGDIEKYLADAEAVLSEWKR